MKVSTPGNTQPQGSGLSHFCSLKGWTLNAHKFFSIYYHNFCEGLTKFRETLLIKEKFRNKLLRQK